MSFPPVLADLGTALIRAIAETLSEFAAYLVIGTALGAGLTLGCQAVLAAWP